jgi:predicted nucleic acid-binding protein
LGDRLREGCRLYVPEITDYELRRKLMHKNFTTTIARLDALKEKVNYLPITTAAMIKAAEFWAWARSQGMPTASGTSLDVDVILAAQAVTGPGGVVATSNTRHLNRFVSAKDWQDTW